MAVVSGYFQVLFSSSVIFSASYAYFIMHENWKQTIRKSHTARNSTNHSTIPKAQGVQKYQLRIKIRRRKKSIKRLISLCGTVKGGWSILLGNGQGVPMGRRYLLNQVRCLGNAALQCFMTLKHKSHRHKGQWRAMKTQEELVHEDLRKHCILLQPISSKLQSQLELKRGWIAEGLSDWVPTDT